MYSPLKFFKRLILNKWSGVLVACLLIAGYLHFEVCSTLWGCLQPTGDILFSSEAGVLAAVVALFLSLYRFVYLRPELLLDAEVGEAGYLERQEGDGYNAGVTLYLVNAGNRFAEDVQLTFALDAFEFDTDLDTPNHPTEDYEVPETTMDTRSGRRMAFIGRGRRHDIFFENVVYERDVHKLYFGEAIFETEDTHEIKYTVACRTHGLRKGKITLEMDDGEIHVTKAYPTLLRQLKAYFGWTPDLKRTQRVENVDDIGINVRVK